MDPIAGDPLQGLTFADRYFIEACVGEGGMGRVYRASHQRVSRLFAIKVLYGDQAAEAEMQQRFAREAETACRLSHPNVVSVVDFGETEQGLLYLVMDWVEGPSLARIVRQEGPMLPARAIDLTRQLCLGLEHAHDRGLVHRDFKGDNVIIARDGEREVPRIVDFGLALAVEEGSTERLTAEGVVMGTPAYMSPEQASGKLVDLRTDLFSLGILLYEMLTGKLPFDGPPVAVMRQNLAVPPPAMAERVPGLRIDPRLEAVASKLMAKRPEDRFQNARQVIEALDAIGQPRQPAPLPAGVAVVAGKQAAAVQADAYSSTVMLSAAPPPARRGLLWGAGGLAVLGVLALLALALRGGDQEGRAPGDVAADARAPQQAAPADAARADAIAEVPGAVQTPDAGAAPDAAPARADTRARPARSRREVETRERPGGSRPAPEEISERHLQALYVEVGEAIERLGRTHGKRVAAPLRDAYLEIPLSDALRVPSLRLEVRQKLRVLRRRVRRMR